VKALENVLGLVAEAAALAMHHQWKRHRRACPEDLCEKNAKTKTKIPKM